MWNYSPECADFLGNAIFILSIIAILPEIVLGGAKFACKSKRLGSLKATKPSLQPLFMQTSVLSAGTYSRLRNAKTEPSLVENALDSTIATEDLDGVDSSLWSVRAFRGLGKMNRQPLQCNLQHTQKSLGTQAIADGNDLLPCRYSSGS